MIKGVLFTALIFAAPFCLVSAQDAKVSVDMMGIGGMSCAHWRSTQEHLLEGTVWIYGFWTGLNYVAAASESNAGENRRGVDSGRSRKDMRSANVPDISQRGMDHLSWV
jgi:hypothetical protein